MVEILIVVVITGILAALVVPQFANATEEAGRTATIDSLTKIRRAIDVYYIRNGNLWPNIIEDNGQAAWGELMTNTSNTYLREFYNYWVPSSAARVVIFGTAPGRCLSDHPRLDLRSDDRARLGGWIRRAGPGLSEAVIVRITPWNAGVFATDSLHGRSENADVIEARGCRGELQNRAEGPHP